VTRNAYPVLLDVDAGADPSVPARTGWQGIQRRGLGDTNTTFDLIGDPRAVKGGVFREYVLDFPGTLRMEGPESNSALNYTIGPMVYESLVNVHPTTLAFILRWPPTGRSPRQDTYRFASTRTPVGPTASL
jgi:hypothetical protein